MRKYYCFILIPTILFMSCDSGQRGKPDHKIINAKFETFYNARQADSLFALFSPEMKEALPIETTIQFFNDLFSQSGKIKKSEFKGYDDSYAVYRTEFEKAINSVNISLDKNSRINGMLIRPYPGVEIPAMPRNKTNLQLPFKDEWTVFWGGDTKEQNYHVEHPAQKNAFDLVITDKKGRSFKTDGTDNEDYYAFGKEIFAPCDGVVIQVIDGIHDNQPGIMNPQHVSGNTVIIKTVNHEYLFFAHFKEGSIVIKEGQQVRAGQLLGHCGNSGHSSEPHLHFHIQDKEDMSMATGIKCYFARLLVNGELKTDYSPVRMEKIRPEKK